MRMFKMMKTADVDSKKFKIRMWVTYRVAVETQQAKRKQR